MKKLSFNKEVVAILNSEEMSKVYGGDLTHQTGCCPPDRTTECGNGTQTCPNPTDHTCGLTCGSPETYQWKCPTFTLEPVCETNTQYC